MTLCLRPAVVTQICSRQGVETPMSVVVASPRGLQIRDTASRTRRSVKNSVKLHRMRGRRCFCACIKTSAA